MAVWKLEKIQLRWKLRSLKSFCWLKDFFLIGWNICIQLHSGAKKKKLKLNSCCDCLLILRLVTERFQQLWSYHFVCVFKLWRVLFFDRTIMALIKLNFIGRNLHALLLLFCQNRVFFILKKLVYNRSALLSLRTT